MWLWLSKVAIQCIQPGKQVTQNKLLWGWSAVMTITITFKFAIKYVEWSQLPCCRSAWGFGAVMRLSIAVLLLARQWCDWASVCDSRAEATLKPYQFCEWIWTSKMTKRLLPVYCWPSCFLLTVILCLILKHTDTFTPQNRFGSLSEAINLYYLTIIYQYLTI